MESDAVECATHTSREQEKVEASVLEIYRHLRDAEIAPVVLLMKDHHVAYLKRGIRHLSTSFECLDASRPWLCYWILHSLALLKSPLSAALSSDVVGFLSKCQSPTGGYGGGPGQIPHLAPTYAAVLALCTIGTEQAYNSIDRAGLQKFILSLHQDSGGFVMHEDGELDIRGCYCAVVSAILTNTATPELFHRTGAWVASCQTYEGGYSAVSSGTEAHGGYTFCGFAAAHLLQQHHLCDLQSLLRWVSYRQMDVEGGFQGRTNKLVDGCYSFWQGGVFPLIYQALEEQGDSALDPDSWMFCQESLQEYVLYCCQHPGGGLIDKPGKSRDFYHTCYCLSGLSVSQHGPGGRLVTDITSDANSILAKTHPSLNIVEEKAKQAIKYFSALSCPKLIHF